MDEMYPSTVVFGHEGYGDGEHPNARITRVFRFCLRGVIYHRHRVRVLFLYAVLDYVNV